MSFQDQSKRIYNRMILFFCCTNCDRLFQDEEVIKKNTNMAQEQDLELPEAENPDAF